MMTVSLLLAAWQTVKRYEGHVSSMLACMSQTLRIRWLHRLKTQQKMPLTLHGADLF